MADVANISASSGKPGRPRGGGAAERAARLRDDALVDRVAEGEASALAELYDRHARLGFTLARRVCADDQRAEDVVREVFLSLWRNPRQFDPERGEFARWLVTEVHREAGNALRAQGAARRREVAAAYQGDGWTGEFAAGRLRDAFADLPAEQRATFLLAYYGGYTQPETAALTGTSVRTVLARMFRAARRLRRQMLSPDRGDTVADGR